MSNGKKEKQNKNNHNIDGYTANETFSELEFFVVGF